MAIFPLLTHVNFEGPTTGGSKTGWIGAGFNGTTVNDATDKLTIKHYSDLLPYANATPYHGAYCAVVDFSKGAVSDDAYFISTDDFADNATGFYSFKIYLSEDAVIADDTDFPVFAIVATTTGVVCVNIGRTTTSEWFIGVSQTGTTPAAANRTPLTLGKWHHVDLAFNIDQTGSDDGDIDLTVDGVAVTQLASLTQGHGTDVWFGAVSGAIAEGSVSLPSAGFMLLDDLREATSSRIPVSVEDRYQPRRFVDAEGEHVFVGPGWIDRIEFMPDADNSNDSVSIYDTDTAGNEETRNRVLLLTQDASTDHTVVYDDPIYFKRGAYVVLTTVGTQDPGPAAMFHVRPKYWSDGAIRTYARSRKAPVIG